MAAAAPKTLASDSLEVTRSSHLLNIHAPSEETQKALSASAILLADRKERKLARQARNAEKARGMGDFEMDGDMDNDESTTMADALREADVGMMDVEEEEKATKAIQDKIKVRAGAASGGKKQKKESALRRTGGGMGM
jgi:large subunit ribosomal protein L24e